MVFCCLAKKPNQSTSYPNNPDGSDGKHVNVDADTEYEDFDEEQEEMEEVVQMTKQRVSDSPANPSFKNTQMQERDERELFGDDESAGKEDEQSLAIQTETRDSCIREEDEEEGTEYTELKLLQETKLDTSATCDSAATNTSSAMKSDHDNVDEEPSVATTTTQPSVPPTPPPPSTQPSVQERSPRKKRTDKYATDDDTAVFTATIPEENGGDSIDSDDANGTYVDPLPATSTTRITKPLLRLKHVDPVEYYSNRPIRSGMWFVAHESYAKKLMKLCSRTCIVREPIPLWEEFMTVHPVAHDICGEFVMIQLSEEYIAQYPHKIKVASYEWKNVKGVVSSSWSSGKSAFTSDNDPYCAPSNYVWFLEYLQQNEVVGWMDFLSNIAVNVPKEETIGYMGMLYAKLSIISEWMVIQKKTPVALEYRMSSSIPTATCTALDIGMMETSFARAWMYPEMSFGRMEDEGVEMIIDKIRQFGLESLPSGEKRLKRRIGSFAQFCHMARIVSQLLHRRGYHVYQSSRQFLKDRSVEYYSNLVDDGDASAGVANLVLDRILGEADGSAIDDTTKATMLKEIHDLIKEGYGDESRSAMYHFCDFFTLDDERELTYRDYPQLPLVDVTEDPTYLSVRKSMIRLCTCPSWKVIDADSSNLDLFFEQFAVPLLTVYGDLNVTREEDRKDALTSVALAIISSSYKEGMNVETFWQRAWSSTAKLCRESGEENAEGFASTPILTFQPTMSEYNRFPGRIHVSGALLGGDGGYETIDGTITSVEWTTKLVTEFATDVKWDAERLSWYIATQKEVEMEVTNIISADDGEGGKEIQVECKNQMQEESREWCDVYFCNPPLGNNTGFACGIVLTPVGCKCVSKAWFFTNQNPPSFPKPANNAVFT